MSGDATLGSMIPRLRFLLLGIVLSVAFLLRAWRPERMAIEHFDEGVYASNFFSGHLGNRYPDQHLYAPPFWPALLEWVLIFSGANPHAVMWVNVFLGTALVAAVWWTTRVIADDLTNAGSDLRRKLALAPANGTPPGAGSPSEDVADRAALAAATLTTFNETLIEYSRAALTDIPLTLGVTLAVGSGVKALRGDGPFWIPATAALTALAWWTKYNGWLPLAILAAGIAGWTLFTRPDRTAIVRAAGLWGIVTATAFLLWSPVLWQLQQYGGYASVAKNHAGYVVGPGGWGPSAWRHLWAGYYSMSPLFLLGLIAAIAQSQLCYRQTLRGTACFVQSRFTVLSALGFGTACLLGPLPAMLAMSLAGAALSFRGSLRAPLTLWTVAAWILGLVVATPLYRPYPRLVLPLIVGASIGAGLALAAVRCPIRNSECLKPNTRLWWIPCLVYPAGLLLVLVLVPVRLGIWSDRNALRMIAAEIIARLPRSDDRDDIDSVVYVLAEPGLYYHLAAYKGDKEIIAQPASNLGMLVPGKADPRVPTYIVTGPHAADEDRQLASHPAVIDVAQWPYEMSDLVLLDEVGPAQLAGHRRRAIRLWRIETATGSL